MGRKKKQFINKKEAHTYRLVARSHQDPLAGYSSEAQNVLKLAQPQDGAGGGEEDRLKEQQKYGIFFQDNYDYLQHLRPSGTAVLVSEEEASGVGDGKGKVHLPASLFGAEVEVEGELDRVLPVTGPCPDWDPDVVEALENAELASGDQTELEDDFVMLANGGEPGLPVYVSNHQSDGGVPEGVWWMDRVDYMCSPSHTGSNDADVREKGERELALPDTASDAASGIGSLEDALMEKKTAQFTEYSMTSSVIPRSEALTLLDDRFEEFMVQYNNDQLGPGEEEEEEVLVDEVRGQCRAEFDEMLLQTAVEDFEKNFTISSKLEVLEENVGEEEEQLNEGSSGGDSDQGEEEEEASESEEMSSKEDQEPLDRMEVANKSKWDCESILSTYSTLYNHPTKIIEPPSASRKVKLSKKTGLPLGVIPGPQPKEHLPKKIPISRPKKEDREDKRLRKSRQKEERKQRRADKKASKLAFKSEALKQEKCLQNNTTVTAAFL